METKNLNNQMQNYPVQGYRNEDEIDLYDLVEILVKHKITIVVTAVLVTLLSLGAALHARSNNKLKFAQDFDRVSIQEFYIKKANLNIREIPAEGFIDEKEYQDLYFQDKNFQDYYKSTLGEKVDNYSNRKEFLNKVLKIEKVEEDREGKKVLKNLKLIVELPKKQEGLQEYMIDKYIDLYEIARENQLKTALEEKHRVVKAEKENYGKQLTEIENKVQKLISTQPKEILMNESIVNIIATKYPTIFHEKNQITELFNRYSAEFIGTEGALKEELNQKKLVNLSSIYSIQVKSKATLILAVGMVLGIFLGIFMAFLKEFVTGYKRREKKN